MGHRRERLDLVADIGGTHARLALLGADGRLREPRVFLCADYPGFEETVDAYLAGRDDVQLQRACLAVATNVDVEPVQLTNSPWRISRASVARRCALDEVVLINDFEGQALAIPHLAPGDLRDLGGGTPRMDRPMAILGPGTGLGVAGLVPDGDHWRAVGGEGGHVPFAPVSDEEQAIWRLLHRTRRHVSAEELLSGPGLQRLYRALCELDGVAAEPLSAADVTRRAIDRSCPRCVRVVGHFSAMLGTVACTVALILGARGGIYLAGGIVPRLGDAFDLAAFRDRIAIDGARGEYMAAIATRLIVADHPALLGAASVLRPGRPVFAPSRPGAD